MSECRKFRTQLALISFRMGDLPPYTSWKQCRRLSSNRRHLDPEGALPGRVPVDGVEHFIFTCEPILKIGLWPFFQR